MDTSSVNAASSLVTSMSGDNAATYALKKAMDLQAASAAQLINSVPQPAKVDPNATIGSNIDTKA